MGKVAITGASGRLGRHVLAKLSDLGRDVRPLRSRAFEPGLKPVEDFFDRERPRILVHLAALTPQGQHDPSAAALMSANFELTRSVCDAGWARGVRTFVLASTTAVYGIPTTSEDLAEAAPCRPTSDYGRSKLAMERWAMDDLATRPGTSVVCLRIGNVSGADSWLGQVFARYRGELDELVLGRFPTDESDDDPSPRRSYIAAADVGTVIDGLLELQGSGVEIPVALNVGSAQPVSMLGLLRSFERLRGIEVPFRWQDARDPSTGRIVLDTKLLHSLIAVPPESSGADYLARSASEQFL